MQETLLKSLLFVPGESDKKMIRADILRELNYTAEEIARIIKAVREPH